ncbi:VanZ family protein [Clostridium sp. FP1]|uniref:VanZ family protein n=1 Tax=Clostridium sp. FP1 TaxID=2724076 RepID=UPI0013E90CF7|nr:VanZ family protein [Clostridium sp. FP1]MBZ9634875.1 VanZ family protein [Clostridium sp. FP1]
MLSSYLQNGMFYFYGCIHKVLIIFCVFTVIKFLVKRKFEIKPLIMLCEFAWILIVFLILQITGIIGDYFGTTSFFDGIANFSFDFFKEGLSIATLLNIILFIPFGFFSAIVFKKLMDKWIYGVLMGLIFSIIIEFLQTFNGRYGSLQDVIMNTIGTFIGYEIWFWLSRLIQRQKK